MVKKEEMAPLKPKKRKLSSGTVDVESDIISNDQHAILTTEQRYLRALYEGEMKPAQRVLCVERHQRINVGYLRTDTPACEWGRTRDNATTCGDCS
ncbi:unnamed protein product, partial [marine sediment metagenome]